VPRDRGEAVAAAPDESWVWHRSSACHPRTALVHRGQDTSFTPESERGGCRNSEVLLSGVCFLARGLQPPVASCMQSSAPWACGLAEPGLRRALEGLRWSHSFELLFPAWAWQDAKPKEEGGTGGE